MLVLQLPPELDRDLEEQARAAGRSKSDYALEVLAEHLADMEDLRIAEERMENLRAGKSRTFTIEEVKRELGLED